MRYRIFIRSLEKQIRKYEKEHPYKGIKTCDVDDVWE